MSSRDFLLEIGLEEMPARFVTDAMNQLKDKLENWLKGGNVAYEAIEAFSTPRRLAIVITGVAEKQQDMIEEARGPAKKIAVDEEGNWTKAALGFARGQGISADELFFNEINGQEYVFAKKHIIGQETKTILPQVEEIIKSLHFPKNMRWNRYDLRYVRPIQWLVALYGNEVIPFEITNVQTGNRSVGHRFLGSETTISEPSDYVKTLLAEYVIVNPLERKAAIRTQIKQIEEQKGWVIPIDENLLEEVNNLVEYPTALHGSFDESFLEVPEEVLITSMREHQRYFPVQTEEGKLLPHFITVRNGNHEHLDNVVKGNEKVLRARLSDAQFFYREDQKLKIENALSRLETIVYHEELGTLSEKVGRIEAISSTLAAKFEVADTSTIKRAAKLCKFDLVTQMVYEFPELQGRMGEEYALKAGEAKEVAVAIREHYMPRFANDESPTTITGTVVSIADKLDTIVTCFGIGLIPSGSQDPYALRRQAAGIIQMILDKNLSLSVEEVIEMGLDVAENKNLLKRNNEEVYKDLIDFFRLRVKNALQERGTRYDVVDAVLSEKIGQVDIIVKKAQLLMEQIETPQFKETVEALSRVTNISSKAGELTQLSESLFEQEEERALYKTYLETDQKVKQALENSDVKQAYNALVDTQKTINLYFDNIMVMSEDEKVKQNRLVQMKLLANTIQSFANFNAIVFA
ncbi:glycine--tRNA ligase subunit beta [Alkalihalobacterium elongatum]|uniref:glycine--tRNA ligase subunit beta n=1 Tax=Alkalihalobacterium elongatum TaxID=2675466 RepID=UPI001C1FACB3|nr:glycine--tRNA ligase subunit beta [Alkalihalobacterium elongatum]